MLIKVWQEMIKDRTGEWGTDIQHWDWVPGVGVIAMLEYYESTRQPEVLAYLQDWVKNNEEKAKGKTVINSIAPYAIFPTLYRITGEAWYKDEAVRIADWLIRDTPCTREDAFEHTVTENVDFSEQVWADTIFMAVLFIALDRVRGGILLQTKKVEDKSADSSEYRQFIERVACHKRFCVSSARIVCIPCSCCGVRK